MKRLALVVTACSGLWCASPAHTASCEDLAKLALPATAIASTEIVAKGAFVPPPARRREAADPNAEPPEPVSYASVPAFCRLKATLKPSSDSDIKIEVWLPVSGWNGKFQGVGPYGQVARWKGTGSSDEAANFACVAASVANETGSRR